MFVRQIMLLFLRLLLSTLGTVGARCQLAAIFVQSHPRCCQVITIRRRTPNGVEELRYLEEGNDDDNNNNQK